MSDMTAAEPGPPAGAPKPAPSAGPPASRPARPSKRHRLAALEPLLWIGRAIALIAVAVLWPIVTMVQTSFQNITPLGITIGSAGLSNFSQVFKNPNLPGILVRTVIWVAASVAITMVISLGLAQLYNQRFPGRRFARWAIIAPWAASVMMTALIFRWVLQPENGVVNVFLHQLGLVQRFNSNQADWLGRPDSALVWMIGVAVFVSLPFPTYALLARLPSLPRQPVQAARGAGAPA